MLTGIMCSAAFVPSTLHRPVSGQIPSTPFPLGSHSYECEDYTPVADNYYYLTISSRFFRLTQFLLVVINEDQRLEWTVRTFRLISHPRPLGTTSLWLINITAPHGTLSLDYPWLYRV